MVFVLDTFDRRTRIEDSVLLLWTIVAHVMVVVWTLGKGTDIVVYRRCPMLVNTQTLILMTVFPLTRESVHWIINIFIFIILLFNILIINLLMPVVLTDERTMITTFRYSY